MWRDVAFEMLLPVVDTVGLGTTRMVVVPFAAAIFVHSPRTTRFPQKRTKIY